MHAHPARHHPRRPLLAAAWTVLLAATVLAPPALAAAAASGKLDPRLLPLAADRTAAAEPVWVEFADKGERDPADLAERLAAAEAALDPRNRARRLKAGMRPLVDYLDLPVHAPYVAALSGGGFAPYGASRWFNRVAVRADAAALDRLVALPWVRRLAPVERAERMERLPAIPEPAAPAPVPGRLGANATDVAYGRTQWLLQQMNVPAVHDSGWIGTGVWIVVLDEGFNLHTTHEATQPIAVPPARRRDFVDGDGTITDPAQPEYFSHGQWVLGCVGGNKPGSYVGSGFGATFALGRTEDSSDERHVEMVWWGMGAEWADSMGADIVSSSLGYRSFNPPDPSYGAGDMDGRTTIISRAAQIAAARGILVVNSAGNLGSLGATSLGAPADVNGDSLIAVGAIDSLGNVAGFSSRGPTADGRIKPDLVARGVSAPTVSATGSAAYLLNSGTSFSTPFVAGLAACLMQARPSWPAVTIIRALRETASRANNPDNHYGYGIPNGLAALQWVDDTVSVPPAPPGSGLRFALLGPNPFGGDGAPVRLRLVRGADLGGDVRLAVLDLSGRTVATPELDAAAGIVRWSGHDDDGEPLEPGVYFVLAEAAGRRATARVVLAR